MTVADLATFRSAMRQAAVDLLSGVRDDYGITLQIYRARPRSLMPPTAFIDRITESIADIGLAGIQRTPRVEIVVLHGLFDSGDAVDQADRFVDAFIDYVRFRYHAAGANSLVATVAIEDDANYTPDWQPPEVARTYYASLITLEGFAGG